MEGRKDKEGVRKRGEWVEEEGRAGGESGHGRVMGVGAELWRMSGRLDTGKHGWRVGSGRVEGRRERWWMAEWTERKVNGLGERGKGSEGRSAGGGFV